MDSGAWQAWIAGAAAVVALGAAGLSWWQAREAGKQAKQATRQADAAHGDVEPTFHLQPITDAREEWAVHFVARNFNRYAVLIDAVAITFPDTFLVLKETASTRTTRQSVEGFVQQRRGHYGVRPLETLPGLAPGGENAADCRFAISLRPVIFDGGRSGASLQTLSVVEGDRIEIAYSISYKVLDGLDVMRTKSGKLSLVA